MPTLALIVSLLTTSGLATAHAADTDDLRTGRSYVVNAMVGQVNGRPVYAQRVFDPVQDQLSALGRSLSRAEFRREVEQILMGRVQEIVTDALILGEAERDLSMQERQGLRVMLQRYREELLRQFGEGAPGLAEARSLEQDGRTIDQRIEEYRQQLIVRRYMREKLFHQINITRKDTERYYNDHYDLFNSQPSRTVHMIRVTDAAAADQVDHRLASGESFLDIASDGTLNRNRASAQGLFVEDATGEAIFGVDALNAAMLELEQSEHSPRIELPGGGFAWIYLASLQGGTHRSFREVQLEIEDTLHRQEFQRLTREYRERLFREGSYNPIHEMVAALVEVAMGRWAQPD